MSIFIYKHKRYVYQTTIKLNVLQTPHKSPLKKRIINHKIYCWDMEKPKHPTHLYLNIRKF